VTSLGFSQSPPAGPRETLKQYVADLQKNPQDDALREKIIKLALNIDPKPMVPHEVDEFLGKATYILKSAHAKADFAEAATAFEKAILLAPWVGELYFNLGVADEGCEYFETAIHDFELYLIAAPDAQDSREVRQRIGALKYRNENRSKWLKQTDGVLDLLRGKWYVKYCSVGSTNPFSNSPTFASGCSEAERKDDKNWDLHIDDHGKPDTGIIVNLHHTVQLWVVGCNVTGALEELPDQEKGRLESVGPQPAFLRLIRWQKSASEAIYSEMSDDGRVLTVGCDRPLAGYNPNTRYHYRRLYRP